jgi:two-component system, OmpR family, phosphate regulon sensor histidine kinase PhoR
MSRRLIRLLVILSVVAIIGILTVQAIWLRRAYALGERQFRQTAFVALQEVANDVARLNRMNLTKAAVTQLAPNYFVVRTDAPIDPVTLEHYLQTAFVRHKLLTDFEYGLYNCESEQMVYGAYVSTQPQQSGKLRQRFGKGRTHPKFPGYTYYFEVRFPGQGSLVAGQLDGWIASSVAVGLVVLLFGYTLWVVLRQRRLTEIQRDFINNVTHELQTPVSTLRIAADVLQQPQIMEQPDRLRQYARVVADESRRLQRQVQSVLQVARRNEAGIAPTREPVDLHALITELAVAYAPHVRLDLQANPALLMADRYALETMLNNLIDNALKYCAGTPCITLAIRTEGTYLTWSVADNGVGISKAHQKAIFQQFYRIPTGDVHNVKGFGLGLYHVKQVVKAHGWTIKLDSDVGRGSVFEVKCKM